jgi:hypothetical protein
MKIVTLSLEEWTSAHPSLYWFSPLPGDKEARDFAFSLFHKVNGMASIRHTNMNEKWEQPFYRSIEYTVKYAQKGLLGKPYFLMEVLYHIHKGGMGEDPAYTWRAVEQHLVRFLNTRLQKLGASYRYFDPTSRTSHLQ